jgi:hypothetical protein
MDMQKDTTYQRYKPITYFTLRSDSGFGLGDNASEGNYEERYRDREREGMCERERAVGWEKEGEGEGKSKRERGREREREGEEGGDVTFWYLSTTKVVPIKLRHKTFTWVVRACLPDMDESGGG